MGKRGPKIGQKFAKSAQSKINDKVFDASIKIPLKAADFANCFSVSIDTLDRYCASRFQKTFAEVQKENMGIFKRNIIGKQYEVAMKGNTHMLRWLGQNYSEQSEKIEQKQSISIEPEIEYKTRWGGVIEAPSGKDDGGE
jgi:hypothetical protein